jgi:hypothetical protein
MARTLTQIRKDTDLSVAADVRTIATLFAKIAATNPDAVKAVLSDFARRTAGGEEKTTGLIELYHDTAIYLSEVFNAN